MNVEANRLGVYITEESFELDYITDENLNDEESSLLSLYQKNKLHPWNITRYAEKVKFSPQNKKMTPAAEMKHG